MTRQEFIEAVKVKIEEISPFDEPVAFIADDDSSANTVKPIISYIDKSLDEAAKNCLLTLPISLLHADIETVHPSIDVAADGVGKIAIADLATKRLIRFRNEELQRDITAFITSEDPIYLLQQNKYTRGGQCKPVAVSSSDGGNKIEIYSFKATGAARTINGMSGTSPTFTYYTWLLYINLDKKPGVLNDYLVPGSSPAAYTAEVVQSPIEDFIVLECARMVFNILKDYDGAKVCESEQAAKIQTILK